VKVGGFLNGSLRRLNCYRVHLTRFVFVLIFSRFLIGPLFVIIAYIAWPKYARATIVNGVDNCIAILAHTFLLVRFSRLLKPTVYYLDFVQHSTFARTKLIFAGFDV
jgi:hypothetical protein